MSDINGYNVTAAQVAILSGPPTTNPDGTTTVNAFQNDPQSSTDPTGWPTASSYIQSFTFTDSATAGQITVTANLADGTQIADYSTVTASGVEGTNDIVLTPTADGGNFLAGATQGILVSSTALNFAPADPSTGTLPSTSVTFTSGETFNTGVSCFATGTLILTADGEVPVEQLKVGDQAVTASGAVRPVRWIGHRRFNGRTYPHKHDIWPVRIAAGAFGPQQPSRDLLLSPGHAVMVTVLDEVLIPAIRLVNGATIRQEPVEEITYWHVELDTPDVLLANRLPAESYIDVGNRGSFTCADATVSTLTFSEAAPPSIEWARPKLEHGDVVRAVRERLGARATAAGWTLQTGFDGFHALVDGAVVQPQIHDGKARFLIPADATDVRLIADASAPITIEGSGDTRLLGVAISALAIDDALTERREIALDDPRLSEGFFGLEQDAAGRRFRWTGADCVLPASLWEGCVGLFFLQVSLYGGRPRWVAPVKQSAAPPLQVVSGF